MHRPEEIRESDIGTRAGLFDVRKIGDEFFAFIVDCEVGAPVTVSGSSLTGTSTSHSNTTWCHVPRSLHAQLTSPSMEYPIFCGYEAPRLQLLQRQTMPAQT